MPILEKNHPRQMSDSYLTAVLIVLSGGLLDAYTYFCRGQVFANAPTGNIVLMSAQLASGQWLRAVRYLTLPRGAQPRHFLDSKYSDIGGTLD